MTTYEIRQGSPDDADIAFYGNNRAFMSCKDAEVIVAGPAETGKTIAALFKLHIIACKYKGASVVIARKTLASTYASVLQTLQKKVLGDNGPAAPYGGEKPQWFDYPNGSRIWIAGLDKPGKVLSSEHDVIYVNQAEELKLDDWETLTTRTTGRAGNMPYSQTIGDCNPSGSLHWIVQRANAGALTLFKSKHRDNPALYHQDTGELTEQGKRTIAALKQLTGHRYKRLFLGEWASPEGLVYERFSEDNVDEEADYNPERGPVELAVDDGFASSPRAMLFIQVDDDGIINIFDELYHLRHLADTCIGEAKDKFKTHVEKWVSDLFPNESDAAIKTRIQHKARFEIAICDPSAVQLMASMRKADIPARGGKCGIEEGIKHLEQFVKDADGKIRIRVHPRCQTFISEMSEGYKYPDGEGRTGDVKPIKENDHGPDALRYWAWLRMRSR